MSKRSANNYLSTFVSVADDCPVHVAEEPPARGRKATAAQIHLRMARNQCGEYTQEQILFRTHLNAKGLPASDHPEGGQALGSVLCQGPAVSA